MSNAGLIQVLIGAGGMGLIGGGPAWFYIRAQNRKTDAAAEHEEAETDSVIVTTTDRLVEIVNKQMERVVARVENLEEENEVLRDRHTECERDLRRVRAALDAETKARKRDGAQIEALLFDADLAREERIKLQNQVLALSVSVGQVVASSDAKHALNDRESALDDREATMDDREADMDAREGGVT